MVATLTHPASLAVYGGAAYGLTGAPATQNAKEDTPMPFKERTGSTATSIGAQEPGWSLEGFYLGSKTLTTKYGDRPVHIFEDADGHQLEIWGTARLTRRLDGAEDYWTRIEYVGPSVDKHGNRAHDVRVFTDADRRREQQELPI